MLVLTAPEHGIGYRLVEIDEDGKGVTLISATSYNRFSYSHFFEVNKIVHVLGKDISIENALDELKKGYDPEWFVDNGIEYTNSQVAVMQNMQAGKLREIEYLESVMREKEKVHEC